MLRLMPLRLVLALLLSTVAASAGEPGPDGFRHEGPRFEGARPDGPRLEQPRLEQPRRAEPRLEGPRPEGPRLECFGPQGVQSGLSEGRIRRFTDIRPRLDGEIVRAEFCRAADVPVYRVTLMDSLGRVRRVLLDARDGRLLYDARRDPR